MIFFRKTKFDNLDEALLKPQNCQVLRLVFTCENLNDRGETFLKFINLKELFIQGDASIWDAIDYQIPSEIASLTKLRKLELLNYPLVVFPKWISTINTLEYLMVRGNEITEIPESIADLENLKTLRVENCDLNSLPKSLKKMENLKYLGLSDTKLTNLDVDQFPKTLKAINFCGTGRYQKQDLLSLKLLMPKTKIHP